VNLRKDHYRTISGIFFPGSTVHQAAARCAAFWGGMAFGLSSPTRWAAVLKLYFRTRVDRTGIVFFCSSNCRGYNVRVMTTSNGGPLGSCVDEERSKLRYVV
jgi:hypothetical protein